MKLWNFIDVQYDYMLTYDRGLIEDSPIWSLAFLGKLWYTHINIEYTKISNKYLPKSDAQYTLSMPQDICELLSVKSK